MPKVSVVIVGAGLAGLSAAYGLAKEGIDVLVVERAEYPGAKSVTGGRMYFLPIKDIYPELWSQAPWERHVVRETLTMVSEHSSVSVEFLNQKYGEQPYHSYTVLASRFNTWFSKRVTEKGARIISKYRVDDLITDQGKVKGIKVGGSEIEADVVIAADGIMSQISEKAGLRGKYEPQNYALGVKEVIRLSPETIEERFGLGTGEGAARLYVGSVTRGMLGGGFLYTNTDSVSLGVVLGMHDLANYDQKAPPYEILEDFKSRPEIRPLIQGGESIEYSAHALSESGVRGVPKLYGDGILVAGDAAGLTMNLGLTVRGMDFAVASGALAAQAVIAAKKQNDFSADKLARYEDLVKESFVGKDFTTFRYAPQVLANPRIFGDYPQFVCDAMEGLMSFTDKPKQKFSDTLLKQLKKRRIVSLVRDVFGMRRI